MRLRHVILNFCSVLVVASECNVAVAAQVEMPLVRVAHTKYTSYFNCETKTPFAVIYSVDKDKQNVKRLSRYLDDPQLISLAPQCHPNTHEGFKTYQSVLSSLGINEAYDVGHLAAANHMDSDEMSMEEVNMFSNLAPQASAFNRRGGAWYYTEDIVECHRDSEALLVVAGTLDDPTTTSKDFFKASFGSTTPDYWYRLIYWQESNVYAAWIMPNSASATDDNMDSGKYHISIGDLAAALPYDLSELEDIISKKPEAASLNFVKTTSHGKTLNCNGTVAGAG